MKKQVFTVLILFLLFLISCVYFFRNQENFAHKILKVVEADMFYIDLNDNGKIDENELVKLEDVTAFYPIKNDFSVLQSEKLGITLEEYLKAGFLARNWAQATLTDKMVYLSNEDKNPTQKYIYSYINYKNTDLGSYLLKNGLGFIYKEAKNKNYYSIKNIKQVKKNAAELKGLDFVILNLKSNIFHTLNCEFTQKLYYGVLILKKDTKSYLPCKVCLDKNIKKEVSDGFIIPQSKNIYKKSVYKKFDNFELFLINPLEFKKPNSRCKTMICKRIVNEINSSKNSIDVALYGIGSQQDIIEALKLAKQRGVKVRAVIDNSKNSDLVYPNTSKFINEFSAKIDTKSSLMHNKFFIFDDKKVLTGSMNISSSGSGGYNANVAVIVNLPSVALSYKKEFEQMYNGKFSTKKEASEIIEKSNITVYFSPKNDISNNLILKEIKNAKKEIFVSIFYLTDKEIIDELIKAKKRGIEVLILMDALCANNFKDRVNLLRAASIPLIVENWGGKNHEKTIVIDAQKLIIGSCNFSKSGFYKNDENILIVRDIKAASLYRDYYLYLFNSIDRKFLKYIPRAEGIESINSCFDGIDNNFDGKIDLEDEGCKNIKSKKM